MDAVQQLEAELRVLDNPVVEAEPELDDTPDITTELEPAEPDVDREAQKLRAAQMVATALDQLAEHLETVRVAAHALVDAFAPAEEAGHPLTVETTPKEPR
jgi:hypothetical protein